MKVPKLRFKDVKKEYKNNKLSKLSDFAKSYPFSRANEGEGEIFHIHYGDIHTKLPTIIENTTDLSSIKLKEDFLFLNKGDIIIADASEDYKDLGKAVCFTGDSKSVIAGLHTHRIKPDKNQIISEYLVRYLQTEAFRKFVYRMGTGVSVLGLSKTNLAKLVVNYPGLEEQKKVAKFFKKLDKKIERQQEKIELLKEKKKSLIQMIFSHELKFKNNKGKEFPKWERKQLNDIADVRDGTHDSPTYYSTGKPLITSKNLLKNGTMDLDNVSFISEEDYKEINRRSKVDKGDILFAMIGTIGNPVLVKNTGFAIKNVALIKVEDVLNSFLLYYLKTDAIDRQFHIALAGGTQKFIALGLIRKLRIEVPVIEEQEKVVEILSLFGDKVKKEEEKLKHFYDEKKGFMQKMFI